MKNIRKLPLVFGFAFLTACASSPTPFSSPKLKSIANIDSSENGSVILCKHDRKLSNAGNIKPDAADIASALIGTGKRIMAPYSMYFMKNDGEKLTPLFYSPTGEYACGIVDLPLGSHKIVVAAANVTNFAIMTGKPITTDVEVSKGTPKIYIAGYTSVPLFSITWDFKNVSPNQTVYDECNTLREKSLTFKEKTDIARKKYTQISDILACQAIWGTQAMVAFPKRAQKWLAKRETKILEGL